MHAGNTDIEPELEIIKPSRKYTNTPNNDNNNMTYSWQRDSFLRNLREFTPGMASYESADDGKKADTGFAKGLDATSDDSGDYLDRQQQHPGLGSDRLRAELVVARATRNAANARFRASQKAARAERPEREAEISGSSQYLKQLDLSDWWSLQCYRLEDRLRWASAQERSQSQQPAREERGYTTREFVPPSVRRREREEQGRKEREQSRQRTSSATTSLRPCELFGNMHIDVLTYEHSVLHTYLQ